MPYVAPRSVTRLEEEIAELEKQAGVPPQEVEEPEEENIEEVVEKQPVEVETETEEEKTYKKRYSDLRRHQQKTADDLKAAEAKIKDLQKQSPNVGLPTAEEAAQWAKENPKAAAIIRAIATEQVAPSSNEVVEIKAKLERAEQEALILKTHRDFEELVVSDSFQDWADEQPDSVQKLIFSSDAKDVIWALTQYKKDKAVVTDPKKEAAKAVSKTTSSAPETKTKGRVSESAVKKMSMSDYEKNEVAIAEAMRDGSFVYDLSGGAR